MDTYRKSTALNFTVHEVNKTTVKRDWNWEKTVSVYPYNRIYLVTDGSAEIILKSGKMTLEKGFLYFIPMFQVVTSILHEKLTHHYIHFETVADMGSTLSLDSYTANKVCAPENAEIYFNLAIENRFPKTTAETLRLDAALRFLISHFMTDTQSDPLKKRFDPIIEHIDKNINKKLTVPELADMLGFSRSYFSTLFIRAFNTSPKAFILDAKLHQAQRLLTTTTLPVREISDSLAFDNEAYFSRLFKKKNGLPPLTYRKKSKESTGPF
jgi:AraC-like DNA-binding protein